MPTATAEPAWYLTERAESLAVIYLTENPKVVITRHKQSSPDLDILATLREDDQPGGRFFGIEVQSALSRIAGREQEAPKTFQLPREKAVFSEIFRFLSACFYLRSIMNRGIGAGYSSRSLA